MNQDETRKKKALYMTSNIFSCRLVKKLLAPHGYETVQAVDGLEGIKMALDRSFDLILLDQHLPYLDGLSVATRLRGSQETQSTPIIAFTSKVSKGEQEKVLISGCSGYIEKPLNPFKFHSHVEAIIQSSGKKVLSPQVLQTYNAELVARLQQKILELKAKNELLLSHQEALQGAYRKTRESHAELERLAKMKQHIVAITSHELRTPLSVSTGYLDALAEEYFGELNEEQKTAAQLALEGMKNIAILIDRITQLNRVAHQKFPIKLAELNLNDFIGKSVTALTLFANLRRIEIIEELTKDPIIIKATEHTIRQILTNLIKNALSFTPDGGTITIKTWHDTSRAYCSVSDTGIGIPEDELENIFEAFYQLQDFEHHKSGSFEFMTRGVGVGLALCRGLLKELGGTISAKSFGENAGSTFTFSLPMIESVDGYSSGR